MRPGPKRRILMLTVLGLTLGCSMSSGKGSVRLAAEDRDSASSAKQVVVCYHPLATQIGYDILDQGGNAFDAFVATTAAEYVLGEGVTSLGGPLGALLYDAKAKTPIYLDAGFNQPLDPDQKWDPRHPATGVLVPGAPAGLEAISRKYGRLPFAKVLEPAIELAENGFPINQLYADLIKTPKYTALLKKTSYGRATYFKDGRPLREGELLRLPEMARFLRRISVQGSSYVYSGEWAHEAREEINQVEGHLRPEDFSSYTARWKQPWTISYHDLDIYAPQGSGGLNTLLSLKVLEHTDITRLGSHFSGSADALELMIRIQNEVDSERWLYDQDKVQDNAWVKTMFSPSHLDGVWSKVQAKLTTALPVDTGTHSYHIVVIDRDGNAITGTNTIESMPWGSGIFVEGIPLTASGSLPFSAKPGERRSSPLSMEIGVRDGAVSFAAGAFASSLRAAAFEFITNIVDYDLNALAAVTYPRFGNFAFDFETLKPTGGRWLDPRVDPTIVQTLKKRGLDLVQQGYIDTGLGAVAIMHPDGTLEGATAPLSGVGPAPSKLVGVGISFEVKSNAIYVNRLIPESPAVKSAAIAPGDQLIAVQPEGNPHGSWIPVSGQKIKDVLAMIQGTDGTPVGLRFERDSQKFTLILVRKLLSRP